MTKRTLTTAQKQARLASARRRYRIAKGYAPDAILRPEMTDEQRFEHVRKRRREWAAKAYRIAKGLPEDAILPVRREKPPAVRDKPAVAVREKKPATPRKPPPKQVVLAKKKPGRIMAMAGWR